MQLNEIELISPPTDLIPPLAFDTSASRPAHYLDPFKVKSKGPMSQLVKMESCFVVMNDVLVFINPCSAIEYWKACDEIISKGEIVKQKKCS